MQIFTVNLFSIRQGEYVTLRDSIRSSMQQLEMSARSSFEVELFVSDPQSVSLSDDDMAKIKVFVLT